MLHPALKAMSRLASNRNYDVLDNHADRFKKPDNEFEPRIKITSSESHLGKNSSCYQAPRRRRRKQQQQEPQNKSNESLIKPSINNSNISFRDNDNDYDEEEEEDTKTNRSDETYQDNENDFRIVKKSSKRLIKEDDLNTKSFTEKLV